MNKPRIIVVCGPTATGKSDYAVELALRIGGEVISADSRQVYTGLDIGSGKITTEEMKGITHYLLDVASPTRTFTVAQFQKKGQVAIKQILKNGKTPIICGGSGFYIDALVYNTHFPKVATDTKLRKELEQLTLEDLQNKLQTLDSERFETIDQKNKVRLVRAIEIAIALGSVPKITKESPYDIEWIYLDFPDEVLKERIHKRLTNRMNSGMIEEVQHLHDITKVSWEKLESFGLEYRYLALYLQDKLSYEDMLTQLEFAIWHYAKRQRTWFKKYAILP